MQCIYYIPLVVFMEGRVAELFRSIQDEPGRTVSYTDDMLQGRQYTKGVLALNMTS